MNEKELIDLRARLAVAELSYMGMKDDYAELARALGQKSDAWFGDPLLSHKEIVKRAHEMKTYYATREKNN